MSRHAESCLANYVGYLLPINVIISSFKIAIKSQLVPADLLGVGERGKVETVLMMLAVDRAKQEIVEIGLTRVFWIIRADPLR